MDLSHLRENYKREELRRCDLKTDPIAQFAYWFDQAQKTKILEPNAMALGTVSANGSPSVRTVLLKYFDANGFVFFTNYESAKAKQLQKNPHASLLFQWLVLERQVIVCGIVEKTTEKETREYFAKRPRSSQIGAWASPQSNAILSRETLEQAWIKLEKDFAGQEIRPPPFWGGYRVKPQSIEFWQGRESRLHDRFRYERKEQSWSVEQLAP